MKTNEIQRQLADVFQVDPDEAAGLIASLTPREKDVVERYAHGMSNASTAKQLGISEKTVHCHLFNVKNKLRVPSRGLARLWFCAACKKAVV